LTRRRPAGLVEDEDARAARLLDAQARAVELFDAVATRGRQRQIGGFFEELLDLG